MKKSTLYGVLIFLLLVNFTDAARPGIPTSQRARDAIARVKPALEKELAAMNLEFGAPIYVRIFKTEKELEVWLKGPEKFKLFKTYPVCTWGGGELGPKLKQGDGQAPEGFYTVAADQLNPLSNFHLAFNLGYPNAYDRAHNRTGSYLMVHGDCVSIGCYAMTDAGIDEIYALADAALRNSQPFFRADVFPFRMTTAVMELHQKSEWYSFWRNLKTGFDLFESNSHLPPSVTVKDGRYVFD